MALTALFSAVTGGRRDSREVTNGASRHLVKEKVYFAELSFLIITPEVTYLCFH